MKMAPNVCGEVVKYPEQPVALSPRREICHEGAAEGRDDDAWQIPTKRQQDRHVPRRVIAPLTRTAATTTSCAGAPDAC